VSVAPTNGFAAGAHAGYPPSLLRWLAVALSAVPLLALGRVELLGYDGFWHVFIARQSDWSHLWEEIRLNAHPPFFYLCLEAAIATFGTSLLVYRLVPIAATLAATWLVGRIVERASADRWLPAIAAFAFGSSLATVSIGLDVRAYALMVALVLAACSSFLELADSAFSTARHRARVLFALTTTLAVMTHYVAALFLVACFAAPVLLGLVDQAYGSRLVRQGRRHLVANFLTLGVPAAILAIEYAAHIGARPRRFNHVRSFLFDPQREGSIEFVWRSTKSLLELFVPPLEYRPVASTLIANGPQISGVAAVLVVVAALAATTWLVCGTARSGCRRESISRRLLALLPAVMTILLVALALLERYPYGGPLRHQFFLFPFTVIFIALLVDEVSLRTSRRIRALFVALFALVTLLNATNWMSQFRVTRGLLLQQQMDHFRRLFPQPEVVYVDQYNLVNLFTHHHAWEWRLVGETPENEAVDVWRVTNANAAEMYVCRDRRQWLLDLSSPATLRRVEHCLRATAATQVMVFRPQQRGTATAWPVAQTEALVGQAAARAGLVASSLSLDGNDVYAAFTRP
jgi:uncharacterized membrane protein